MYLIMQMADRRCRVCIKYVRATCLLTCKCVGVGCAKIVAVTEKVKCKVRTQWTGSGEGRMRKLEPRDREPENRLFAAHIGIGRARVHG